MLIMCPSILILSCINLGFFLIISQTLQWPTRKPRLLWPLCTSSLDFPSINIQKKFQIILKWYISVYVEPNKILTKQEPNEAQTTSNILIELVCWKLVHILHSLNLCSFDKFLNHRSYNFNRSSVKL